MYQLYIYIYTWIMNEVIVHFLPSKLSSNNNGTPRIQHIYMQFSSHVNLFPHAQPSLDKLYHNLTKMSDTK
jgi:hypothetical protein